jgi:hypothetical protein
VQVTFFLDEEDLDGLRALEPGRDWREFQRGERAWVLQTYLQLVRAGYRARLASQLPDSGVVVFHAKQRRALLRRRQPRRGLVFVGIRGDFRRSGVVDFEVVQNRHSAEPGRSFFVPHWPQPGLLPRDPGRGLTITRIAYKGFDRNLHPYFRSPEWAMFLAARGIEWVQDSVPFAEGRTERTALDWPDFRTVDLILAVRPPGLWRGDGKPATKLYNAWQAGVPALLSPDRGFAEIRRSPLDYLEVGNPDEAKRGLRRLLEYPDLYRRMVDNGRRRADEYTDSATLRHWLDLFEETLPAWLAARRRQAAAPVPLRLKRWARRAAGIF